MTATTVNKMNLILLQKNDERINAKVPTEFKQLIKDVAESMNMNDSQYIKLAVKERLEKDLVSE